MSDNNNIIFDLCKYELMDSLCKEQAQMKFVMNYPLQGIKWPGSKIERQNLFLKEKGIQSIDQLNEWRHKHLLTNEKDFEEIIDYTLKKKYVLLDVVKKNGESLYLKYKDKLDRVLYSLIRVENKAFATNLYYQIESGEKDFGSVAVEHSQGPESKTNGIVGPVDLTTPHKEISARLRTAVPGALIEPFEADNWFVLLRLEYRFESEYNEQTKLFLGKLVLGMQSKKLSQQLFESYLDKITTQ